ncbi:MAG: hypothetical protein IJH64_01480 [Oscillospiraceae bacterium]|nr:hypothetical protein [Oscillospiraceae bacterium]
METSRLESLSPSERNVAFIKRVSSYVSPMILHKVNQCIVKINRAVKLTKEGKKLYELSLTDLHSFMHELELLPASVFKPSQLALAEDILQLYEYWFSLSWFENEEKILLIISRISENKSFRKTTKRSAQKLTDNPDPDEAAHYSSSMDCSQAKTITREWAEFEDQECEKKNVKTAQTLDT